MKKALIFTLALALCLGLSAPAFAVGSFDDVFEADYYAAAVQWAVENGITTGTSDTTFSPYDTCTTAQILTFLWRSQGEPEPTVENPFSRISPDDYYYKAVLWAYENGLLSRHSIFDPSAPCERSMVVTYLWWLAGCPLVSTFDDDYAPYTISGKAAYYNPEEGIYAEYPLTITFSAASAKKEMIPYAPMDLIANILSGRYVPKAGLDPRSVTLVTLQPGSTISFSDDAAQFVVVNFGSIVDRPEISALFEGTTTSEVYSGALSVGDFWPGLAENFTGNGNSGWIELNGFKDADGDYHIVRYYSGESAFSDVPPGAPYAEAAAWAVKEGITTGTGGDTFSPDTACTRAQIMTFLYRAFAQDQTA